MKARTYLSLLIFPLFGIWATLAVGAKLNLGVIDPAQMAETYPDFGQSLNRAVVGVPGSMLEGGKDYYGHYEDLKDLKFVAGKKAPVVAIRIMTVRENSLPRSCSG